MSDLPQLGHDGKFNLPTKDLKPSLTEALNLALKGQYYRDGEGKLVDVGEKGVILKRIAERVLGMALEGNEKMIALAWDRWDGKVPQNVALDQSTVFHEHIHKFLVSEEDIAETALILAKIGIGRVATQSLMDPTIVIDAECEDVTGDGQKQIGTAVKNDDLPASP